MKDTNEFGKLSRAWIEFNNYCWHVVYENTLGSWVQMPFLGASRNFNSQLMRSFDAWAVLYPATLNYQVVLLEMQIQTLTELMQAMVIRAEKGEPIKDLQQLQQLWGQTADNVYEKTFCQDDNLKVRGKFLNAMNRYKLCQQELMEVWLKQMNLPLRSEVDDIHRSIYELRKDVKALRKTFDQYESLTPQIVENGKDHAAVSNDATRV